MSSLSEATHRLPLKGIKIIAIEQYGAAPFGTMFLADLGADVIKIENHNANGEMGRHVVPYNENNDSLFFQTFSANKKSIALDIKTDKGKAIFNKLITTADALINNLRGDLPEKLQLNYDSLGKFNPNIVCVHLSAYGRHNTRESWPGLDYVMQAEAGYLSITGEPDNPPTRFGLSVVDFQAGLVAALALLAGIIGAKNSGKGQDYDAALFDVAMSNLSYPAVWHMTKGHKPEKVARSGHPSLVPSELYKTSNGWIFIMANKAIFWSKLVNALGKPEWTNDPKMKDFEARLKNRELVVKLLSDVFLKNTTEYWLKVLNGVLPCAPVNNIESALASDFASERQIVQSIPHPKWPNMKVVRQPILVAEEIVDRKPAPTLGANTKEVLNDLGYSDKDIEELQDNGVIYAE